MTMTDPRAGRTDQGAPTETLPAVAADPPPAGTSRRPRRPRPPRGPRTPVPPPTGARAVVNTGVVVVGLVCLWAVLQMLVLSGVSHDRAQSLLYRDFRVELSQTTAPLGPVTPLGEPVALLDIPAIDLDEVVVEGTSSSDLLAGPGHKRNSVLPGQDGVSVIYGKATTYGAPFARLGDLPVGAIINVTTSQGVASFKVIGVRHDGDPLPAVRAAGTPRLLLSAATPGLTPTSTVLVDAEGTGEAFGTPPGLPSAVPADEEAMATDHSGLPLFALCLAVLVGLSVAVVAARQRWSAVLVWTVASPVVIATAWLTTDTVMRLLPNLV